MVTTSFKQIFNVRPLITTAVVLWICVIIYLSSNIFHLKSDNQQILACQSLLDVITGLKTQVDIRSTNSRVFLKSYDTPGKNSSPTSSRDGIHGMSYEILRRRAFQFAREIRFSLVQLDDVNEKIKNIKGDALTKPLEDVRDSVEQLKRQLQDISSYLQVDLDGMGRVDGALESRINDLEYLSNELQKELFILQNPENCKTAKYVVATLNRPCAFGCNAHHLMYCFQMAYATGRTLLLNSAHGGSYTQWWIKNFLPLSEKCSANSIHPDIFSLESFNTSQAIECPYIVSIRSSFNWIPPAVPSHFSKLLSRLHGAPFAWFIGQLAKFLMRSAFDLSEEFKIFANRTENPIVGVHIRRTDKINTEASFHSLEEYMTEVDSYFNFIDASRQMMSRTEEWRNDIKSPFHHRVYHQLNPVKRQVYIATDEPSIFDEAQSKYPNYVFYGDRRRAESAAVSKRQNADSIMGIVIDVFVLSKTDYLVCTFSSQVCRLAYELKQSNHLEFGDASQQFRTLDDVYYYVGQQASPYEVLISDNKTGLSIGDLVHFLGNHWNGYAKVEKVNTNHKIMAPAFKFSSRILSAPMLGAYGNRSEVTLDLI
ncbi:Alpha-(1,6)-fucosyltransferase [Schistosoma japonicum]|nr:Alpha-(1,6)-fucosyltransferase [Schistosoma japonicum]